MLFIIIIIIIIIIDFLILRDKRIKGNDNAKKLKKTKDEDEGGNDFLGVFTFVGDMVDSVLKCIKF
ncbi:hypothetical protein ACE4V3_05565 (plasmid) [Borrelia recurrentis]|uniref:hypothetical protein n=1 Tax=Borrelia recurrentis TaxID=44449 RepID=UPI003672DEDB